MRYSILILLFAILAACGDLEEKPFMAYVKQNDRITKIGSDPVSLEAQPFQLIFTLSKYDTTAMQSITIEAVDKGNSNQIIEEANPRKLPEAGNSHQYQYHQMADGSYETNYSKAEHKMGQLLLELHVDSIGQKPVQEIESKEFLFKISTALVPIKSDPFQLTIKF